MKYKKLFYVSITHRHLSISWSQKFSFLIVNLHSLTSLLNQISISRSYFLYPYSFRSQKFIVLNDILSTSQWTRYIHIKAIRLEIQYFILYILEIYVRIYISICSILFDMWNMWHIGEECQCYQLPYQLENTQTHPLLYNFLRINKWYTAKFHYHEIYLAQESTLWDNELVVNRIKRNSWIRILNEFEYILLPFLWKRYKGEISKYQPL